MAAPALPTPPEKYDRRYFENLLNVLRLYFISDVDQKDPVLRALSTSSTYTGATVSLGVQDGGVTLISTTANAVSVVLPAASLCKDYQFIVKRVSGGANTLTVTATSGNIDSGASAVINTQYTSLTFRSDGTNFWIV